MVNTRKHSPWRKSILIPFWTLQLLFMLALIALFGLSAGVLENYDDYDTYYYYDSGYDYDLDAAVDYVQKVIIPIWITMCVICLILTIIEIIMLAKHKLKPLTMLIMNVVKSAIWTGLFIWDIVSLVSAEGGRTSTKVGMGIEAILVLSFWIPLVYGSIIYHRFRKNRGMYAPVSHPLPHQGDTAYPSQYAPPPPFSSQQPYNTPQPYSATQIYNSPHDLEANKPLNARRESYNHERDMRFEAYKQGREASYSDIGNGTDSMASPPIGGHNIPQVHVQAYEPGTYEMESSRRDLR